MTLQERLKGRNLTELAKVTGVSRDTVSKFVNGHTEPKPETVAWLTQAMDQMDEKAELVALIEKTTTEKRIKIRRLLEGK